MNQAAALSPAVPRPAHVPEAAVYDFDMFMDPRTAPPVFWTAPKRGQYRAPLQQAFPPKAMLALEDDVRTLADQWDA